MAEVGFDRQFHERPCEADAGQGGGPCTQPSSARSTRTGCSLDRDRDLGRRHDRLASDRGRPPPGPTADDIVAEVLGAAQGGSIVLMHLDGYHTFEALPRVVDGLRERGHDLVTLDGLL